MSQIINDRKLGGTNRWTIYRKYLPFYLFLIIPMAQVIIFKYLPMYGIQIAFRDFKMRRGITGSEWVGLKHFIKLFNDKMFYRVLYNTLYLSILSTVTLFPATLIFALLMNEVRNQKFKRITQTITYLPHFLSWVVVGTFTYQMFSPSVGPINAILVNVGILKKPVYFMIQEEAFPMIYVIVSIWKELGWGIIIYLASIAGIDPGLYEAASIDGAGRFRKCIHITIPAIMPTISTLLILRMGTLMDVGFDPIFNLYNEGTYAVADVLSTYIYRRGMIDAKYDYTTAIGLFQNVVGLVLVLGSNWAARKADPDFRIL